MTDIVDDILRRVRESSPSLTNDMSRQIELSIRRDYGGSRVYVRQTCRSEQKEKSEKIALEYINGSVDQVTERFGISRATLYRMIKR